MYRRQPLTIAQGQSISDAADLRDGVPVAIEMPAAWTAAAITFRAAPEPGGTFRDVYNGGTELSVTVGASRYVILDPALVEALAGGVLALRSGTAATPVVQNAGAATTVTLVAQPARQRAGY